MKRFRLGRIKNENFLVSIFLTVEGSNVGWCFFQYTLFFFFFNRILVFVYALKDFHFFSVPTRTTTVFWFKIRSGMSTRALRWIKTVQDLGRGKKEEKKEKDLWANTISNEWGKELFHFHPQKRDEIFFTAEIKGKRLWTVIKMIESCWGLCERVHRKKQKRALIFRKVKLLTGSIDMKSQSLAQFPRGLTQQKPANCSIKF